MLKVSVINVTDAPIAIPTVDQRLFTEWTRGGITDDRDRNVPWKPTFDEPEIAIRERLRLAPGAMRTLTAPLAKLAEFKQAGRYALQLRCRMPGVGMLVAIGAATSLAVETARRFDLTLVGFAREGRFNVYANAERIAVEASDEAFVSVEVG